MAKAFRIARDQFGLKDFPNVHLKLIGSRENDGRSCNLPTASEVAPLIIGDIDNFSDN